MYISIYIFSISLVIMFLLKIERIDNPLVRSQRDMFWKQELERQREQSMHQQDDMREQLQRQSEARAQLEHTQDQLHKEVQDHKVTQQRAENLQQQLQAAISDSSPDVERDQHWQQVDSSLHYNLVLTQAFACTTHIHYTR